MQVGDLCKVVKKSLHDQCHLGDYLILVKCCGHWETRRFKMWETFNVKTGEIHHHWEDDLEVIL